MAKKVKNTIKDEMDIKGAIILVLVLTGVVLVMYLLTVGAQKLGWFDLRYVKPEVQTATISYDNILAGTIFNRQSGEYYVMIADFSSDDNIYLSSLGSSYNKKEDKLNLYSVDLGNLMNKSIIGETSNPSAQSVESLSINEPTLILVKDGRNSKYIPGVENIKTELGV